MVFRLVIYNSILFLSVLFLFYVFVEIGLIFALISAALCAGVLTVVGLMLDSGSDNFFSN